MVAPFSEKRMSKTQKSFKLFVITQMAVEVGDMFDSAELLRAEDLHTLWGRACIDVQAYLCFG